MFASLISFALAAELPVGDAVAGRVVYEANCTACHGVEGDGKGPAAAALKPRPPDFTSPAFQAGRKDADLAATIRAGRPGTPMAAFLRLSDQEVADVVAYIRSLPAAR